MSRRLRPLSMTWVRPTARGLGGRRGRARKPSKLGKESLQSLLRFFLDVMEERIAVRVDPDPERAEVLHAELPQALGHEVLPVDLLDLLDLRGLERSRAADDREVDHPVLAHRLDRLVRQATLAADRAHAVALAERLGEAHHAGARGRADADRLVLARAEPPDVRRRVEEEGAVQVERRLLALVEDANLRAVTDADDVAVHGDEVAGAELADVLFRGGKCQSMLRQPSTSLKGAWHLVNSTGVPMGHQNSRSKSTEPWADTCTEARRAAQHW